MGNQGSGVGVGAGDGVGVGVGVGGSMTGQSGVLSNG